MKTVERGKIDEQYTTIKVKNLIKNNVNKLECVTVKRKPNSNTEVANEKNVDDSIGGGNI